MVYLFLQYKMCGIPEVLYVLGAILITTLFIILRLLVFGAGRRVCLGEALGKNRLFLFAASLLQHYTFTPSDEPLPELDPRAFTLGIVLHPQNFTLKAVQRDHEESNEPKDNLAAERGSEELGTQKENVGTERTINEECNRKDNMSVKRFDNEPNEHTDKQEINDELSPTMDNMGATSTNNDTHLHRENSTIDNSSVGTATQNDDIEIKTAQNGVNTQKGKYANTGTNVETHARMNVTVSSS